MGIKDFFTNRAETGENHPNEALKTHYFKTTKEQGYKAAKEVLLKHFKGEIVTDSLDRGEFVFQINGGKKALIVVTVVSVRPYRTAIDFSVSTETPLPVDFGYSKRVIETAYQALQKQLTFLGTGYSDS
ncbi:cytosolic protein [Alkalihalobacillus sp. CinArs1]|uniref:cytosolic protein n=1 Tax=Alkalihalobacillus sp. CinArs1 TaxID=2995314 RepID=UPI0022DD262A|nr:cytosolic protein [Alkalihalobacillus sp. CinArs1]